ncbi:vacuolar segregation subunit 7-domain-containing protein [Staphylotrichum tortipilum]|uniref:Vacuolar segregation subunit 7-domain-containing protein n=1 Tax=Staphylotrichum tortipilum TaxID=2831512 RepID=A0AAN6MNC2_9PEZI|nr:vacuolar segregation subunit 7-domain-containing protein [Staphylotrichum longicolle]
MDKSPNISPASSDTPSNPALSRESSASTATITPMTESATSRFTSLPSAAASTSASSSAAQSPLPSRDPSPTRPLSRTATSRTSSANSGIRSRKNSQQDLSPSRSSAKPAGSPAPAPGSRTLSSANTPTLLPSTSDSSSPNVTAPMKSPTAMEHLRESPRWPVSPRLRSPPPILHKPNMGLPRRPEPEPPLIHLQRPTPPLPPPELQSDTDGEDAHAAAGGVRTPARGGGGSTSTLETVQEVSPIGSPRGGPDQSIIEKLEDSIISDVASQAGDSVDSLGLSRNATGGGRTSAGDSGSETDNFKAGRRSGATSAPPLTSRQSSTCIKQGVTKSKTGDLSLQSMTVETETVTSIPQAPLVPGTGVQGSSVSLRTKGSTETIRPKRDKKKPTRKQPPVTAGNGEPPPDPRGVVPLFPRLRHHQSMGSVVSSAEKRVPPPTRCSHLGDNDAANDTSFHPLPRRARRRSMVIYSQMSSLLTRHYYHPLASSKADIFEAKIASAVEEANSSDSEETFVYDSNPPDGRERPMRFHSRTPSATSMASQADRAGMRSIHAIMESTGPPMMVKSRKFVNSSAATNGNTSESALVDDDGRGTARSTAGSARGTARHHHHFGRWGRNGATGGNGHPSLFAEHSPFSASLASGNPNSRQSSGPPSPRFGTRAAAVGANGKRGGHLSMGYDLDDTTTGADDETTPLIQSGTVRSARSGRGRRGLHSLRSIEAQTYHRSPPSVLNRFASCLVLTVMLLLVVSGAIGFMFATSQPLTGIQLVSMDHVVASQQELMLDLTIRAHNPNVVVVVVDSADIEVFAKSPHAMTDSEWWRHTHPGEVGPPPPHKVDPDNNNNNNNNTPKTTEAEPDPDPNAPEDTAPNMRLGTITAFESALSFEGSFFHKGVSYSSGEVRLRNPGNGTYGGQERWERIMEDEFQLVLKGVLRYTLPLSQRVRTASISGKTTVRPNAANDPGLRPNGTLGDGGEEEPPENEKGGVTIEMEVDFGE